MNLYLTHSGRLRRRDNTLRFEAVALPPEDQDADVESEMLDDAEADAVHSLPIESIDAVYIFGEITLNSKLVNFLNGKKIPVHFFNWFGHHTGTLLPHAEQLSGDLVIRQAEAYRNPKERLLICRNLLAATFHNIRSILQYYQRRKGGLEDALATLLELESRLDEQTLPEPFKPLLVDRMLFRLSACRIIGDRDFRKHSNGFLLTDEARRRILQEWDLELRKTVRCPALNRSVSYRQLLRLDCYKLVNFLLEGREYMPYRIEY